jgi:hypothetical protein
LITSKGDLGKVFIATPYDNDCLRLPATSSPRKRGAEKKYQRASAQPTMPAARHAIVDLILRPPYCRKQIFEKQRRKHIPPKVVLDRTEIKKPRPRGFLKFIVSGCFRLLVDRRLCDFRQSFVGGLFLFEGFLKERHRIFKPKFLGPGNHRAVA